jgi:hypothetical protein
LNLLNFINVFQSMFFNQCILIELNKIDYYYVRHIIFETIVMTDITPDTISLISAFTSALSELSGEVSPTKIDQLTQRCDEYLKSTNFTGHYLYIISIGAYNTGFAFYCLSRNIKLYCNTSPMYKNTSINDNQNNPSIIYRSNNPPRGNGRSQLIDDLLLSTLSIDQHADLYLNYDCAAQKNFKLLPLIKEIIKNKLLFINTLISIKELITIIHEYIIYK